VGSSGSAGFADMSRISQKVTQCGYIWLTKLREIADSIDRITYREIESGLQSEA
jgi:uncharacterized metal-binding protein